VRQESTCRERRDCGGAQIAALQRFSRSGNKKPSSPRLYRGSSRWLALASLRSNTQRAVNPESKKQPVADLLSFRSRRLRRGRVVEMRGFFLTHAIYLRICPTTRSYPLHDYIVAFRNQTDRSRHMGPAST
jgi:hypothetical protein